MGREKPSTEVMRPGFLPSEALVPSPLHHQSPVDDQAGAAFGDRAGSRAAMWFSRLGEHLQKKGCKYPGDMHPEVRWTILGYDLDQATLSGFPKNLHGYARHPASAVLPSSAADGESSSSAEGRSPERSSFSPFRGGGGGNCRAGFWRGGFGEEYAAGIDWGGRLRWRSLDPKPSC